MSRAPDFGAASATSRVAAYRIDGALVAPDDFYRAACDPRRSVVVEACAGAGKTWMLVSRILRALLEGAAPQEIVAITFTRKAAGEMRARLDEWLREFALADAPAREAALRARGCDAAEARALAPRLAALYEGLLEGGRAVEIRTFHGWFSQLLRAAPASLTEPLGLQGEIELIEDRADLQPHYTRRFLAAVAADPALRADHATLVQAHGRHQAREWLEAALEQRVELERADAAGVLESSVPPAAALWPAFAPFDAEPAAALRAPDCVGLLRALALEFGASGKKQQVYTAQALEAALALDDDRAAFEAAWAALFTHKGTPRKLGERPAQAEACETLQRIADARAQQAAHETHARLVRLSRALLGAYRDVKRERGLADMADLEAGAERLLADHALAGWVQERLDARVRHLLIDEFQDTSPLQWRALHAWLSGYAGAGGGASGRAPLSLFVVGDPKQSIYRFRRADPRVFEETRAFVVQALDGRHLACDHTRRNAPAVLAALNGVFERAQALGEFADFRVHTTGATGAAGEVALLPAVPRPDRPSREPVAPGWRDSLAVPRVEAEEALRLVEARHVADAIGALLGEPGWRPGDVQVLGRKRAPLGFVAEALRERGIPHAAPEQRELVAAPEVRDLLALLDALASPAHALSLAHALRSPVFGADDADLVALAQAAQAEGGRDAWWAALRRGAGAGRAALERARTLLPRWAEAARVLPPHDLLDRIVAEGALRERYAAALPPPDRSRGLAAIDALLAESLRLDGGRYATPYNFVRALRRRRVLLPPASAGDAVQLLTIHGAKGLEARAVFVVDSQSEAPRAQSATLLIDWPADAPQPRRCAFVASESRCPPSLRALMEEEHAGRAREELNGLYVAMTRARERLVFSATTPHAPPPGPSAWQRLAEAGVPLRDPAAPLHPAGAAAGAIVLYALPRLPDDALPRAAAHDGRDDTASEAVRLGRAVHHVLERVSEGGPAHTDAVQSDAAQPPARPAAPSPGAAAPRTLPSAPPPSPRTAPTQLALFESEGRAEPASEDVPQAAKGAVGAGQPHGAPGTASRAGALAMHAARAAAEFGLPAAAAARIAALAATVLESPACRPFFDPRRLLWAGNEVPLAWRGATLRIDRLVALAGEGGAREWWVLDYKLEHAPQAVDAYRAQLATYRDAVQRLQPADTVRAAFVTGAGELVPL